MPTTASPFGLMPVSHRSGAGVRQTAYTIASAYATTIYKYAPVALGSDGTVIIAAAGAANNILGAFMGCEYTLTSTGERKVSEKWPASTAASDIVAYVSDDPDTIFLIQGDEALAVTNIGNHADLAATPSSGTALTGLSTAALDSSTASTTTSQLIILGADRTPDNLITDAYPNVRVVIGNHPFRAVRAAGI